MSAPKLSSTTHGLHSQNARAPGPVSSFRADRGAPGPGLPPPPPPSPSGSSQKLLTTRQSVDKGENGVTEGGEGKDSLGGDTHEAHAAPAAGPTSRSNQHSFQYTPAASTSEATSCEPSPSVPGHYSQPSTLAASAGSAGSHQRPPSQSPQGANETAHPPNYPFSTHLPEHGSNTSRTLSSDAASEDGDGPGGARTESGMWPMPPAATVGVKRRREAVRGRWTAEEHEAFLRGLRVYGREWKRVAADIKTRSSAQIRSHAQKYFAKLAKARGMAGMTHAGGMALDSEGSGMLLGSEEPSGDGAGPGRRLHGVPSLPTGAHYRHPRGQEVPSPGTYTAFSRSGGPHDVSLAYAHYGLAQHGQMGSGLGLPDPYPAYAPYPLQAPTPAPPQQALPRAEEAALRREVGKVLVKLKARREAMLVAGGDREQRPRFEGSGGDKWGAADEGETTPGARGALAGPRPGGALAGPRPGVALGREGAGREEPGQQERVWRHDDGQREVWGATGQEGPYGGHGQNPRPPGASHSALGRGEGLKTSEPAPFAHGVAPPLSLGQLSSHDPRQPPQGAFAPPRSASSSCTLLPPSIPSSFSSAPPLCNGESVATEREEEKEGQTDEDMGPEEATGVGPRRVE